MNPVAFEFNNPLSAVYLLKRRGTVIYVGQTLNILKRFPGHKVKNFDKIEVRPTDSHDLDKIEAALIYELKPKLNQPSSGVEIVCKLCSHRWFGRVNAPPKACPKCKRYDWMKP